MAACTASAAGNHLRLMCGIEVHLVWIRMAAGARSRSAGNLTPDLRDSTEGATKYINLRACPVTAHALLSCMSPVEGEVGPELMSALKVEASFGKAGRVVAVCAGGGVFFAESGEALHEVTLVRVLVAGLAGLIDPVPVPVGWVTLVGGVAGVTSHRLVAVVQGEARSCVLVLVEACGKEVLLGVAVRALSKVRISAELSPVRILMTGRTI